MTAQKNVITKFHLWLIGITLLGLAIRMINVTYSSLWADELYSALLAGRKNSWYEVLYLQRAYQPPLYAFLLWIWVKIFPYNELYIRLLTVLAGTACIYVSGWLGKKIRGEKLGWIMAVLVAFNPTQIWYSLEARFYVFIYLFAALSLLLYWTIVSNKRLTLFWLVTKSLIDAALCYFHHFGIIFLFGQFANDLIILRKDKNYKLFYRKLCQYILAGLLYAPWIFWGLAEAMKVKQYWLKEIDISGYFFFNFGYGTLGNIFLLAACVLFVFYVVGKKIPELWLFPVIVFSVVVIPAIYSYVKMPMLVDRYAMVMAPALYVMIGFGILICLNYVSTKVPKIYLPVVVILVAFLSVEGINMTLIDKRKLAKQPWREMGQWLSRQPDLGTVPVYTQGSFIKQDINIDFYLPQGKKADHLLAFKPGAAKTYLIETDGPWQISDSTFRRIDSFYIIKRIPFATGTAAYGNIYECTLKP